MGWLYALLLTAASLVALEYLGIHPAIVIAILLIAALVFPNKKKENNKNKEEVQ